MPYSAAVIGCGLIGAAHNFSSKVGVYSHTEAYSASPATYLAAVCDLNAARAEETATRWRVPGYTDPSKLYAEIQPEIVSICTPDHTHAIALRQAMRAPSVRAILAEKPLALNVTEARSLIDEAHKRGIVLAVNYSRRYAQGHRQLAARLRAGMIGDIVRFHGYYTKGTRHNGSHLFDWIRMLAGEIASVRGFDTLHESGHDPTLDAHLILENGAMGNLVALDHRIYSLFELELIGSSGRLALIDSGHNYRLEVIGDSPWYAGYRTLLPAEHSDAGLHDTLLHAVNDLANALDQNSSPACTGEDAIAALAVAEAIIESSRAGNFFSVPQPSRPNDSVACVMAVAGDPGGAEALLPVLLQLKSQGVTIRAFAYRQALALWRSQGLMPLTLPETNGCDFAWPEDAQLVLTATSVNGVDWEPLCWQQARERGIPSLAILDYSNNLWSRFQAEGQETIPDRIAVMDQATYAEMITIGFPPENLVITGQPAFDVLTDLATKKDLIRNRLRQEEGISEDQTLILFASQPLAQLRHQPGFKDYGFDEYASINLLILALEKIANHRRRRIRLHIRPHPREDEAELKLRISAFHPDVTESRGCNSPLDSGKTDETRHNYLQVTIGRTGNSREWALAADLVCGMYSVLLQEACYLKCPVLSLLPELQGEDPLPTNRQGLSCAVTDPIDLPNRLEAMLFDSTTRAIFAERQQHAIPAAGATEQVVKLVHILLTTLSVTE